MGVQLKERPNFQAETRYFSIMTPGAGGKQLKELSTDLHVPSPPGGHNPFTVHFTEMEMTTLYSLLMSIRRSSGLNFGYHVAWGAMPL